MQLQNAVQYLQNTLIAIQNEISNSQKYTLLFKYLHNANIQKMQLAYQESQAKLPIEHLSENEIGRRLDAEKKDTSDDAANS